MKYSSQKDIDKAIRDLVRKGWSYRRGSKHGKLRTPSGRGIVTVSMTPSGPNAIKIFYGNVKRAVER
jgi:hypothetical protein